MKILITGSNGLLGQKIIGQLNKTKTEFLATSKGANRNSKCLDSNFKSLDITNLNDLNSVIKDFNPTHIINTAAVTNVDFCEDNIELCHKVNVSAVELMFKDAYYRIRITMPKTIASANGPGLIEVKGKQAFFEYSMSEYMNAKANTDFEITLK